MITAMNRPQITPEIISGLVADTSQRGALLWVYLWARADRETALAWPSTKTITAAIGTNRTRACKEIRRLQSKGWLRIQRRAGRNTFYTVIAPSLSGCNQTVTTETGDVFKRGQHLSPNGDNTCHQTGTHNTTTNTTKNTKRQAAAVVVPEGLQKDGFQAAWERWGEYRRSSGKKLTPQTQEAQLKKLAALGPIVAIRWIEEAIERGWQGLYPPKDAPSNGKPSRNGTPTSAPYVASAAD